MALVVDTTKKYRNIPDGQNFTFSLSKPLNQLTADDLQSADSWVGFNCCSINQIYEGKGGEGIPENNPNYCNLWGTDPSWWFDQTNWASVHWSYPANQPTGVYMRNVYVNRELNPGDYTVANTKARIVLEITPDENTTIQKLCMVDNSNYLHAEYNTSSYDSQLSDFTYISPAVLLVVNNCVYLINQNIERFFVPNNIGFYINSTTDQGYQSYLPSFENISYHKLAMGWTMGYTEGSIEDNCVKTGSGQAPIYTYNDVDFNGHKGILQLTGGSTNYHIRISCTMSANTDDSDFSLIHRAYSGMRFRVNGTWYKPIVQGGIVTGYTDDMTVESEWDTWTKASGHNVPVGPPSPEPDPSYEDDPWNNIGISLYSGNAGAFTNVIGLSSTECESLAAHLNSINMPIGYDPMPSIIGLKYFPFPLSGTGTETTVKFQIGPGRIEDPVYVGGGVWDTTVPCRVFTETTEVFDLGTVTIPERMSERGYPFADYQTSFEAYIPFIGSMPLNTEFIMGKVLHAYLYVDYVSGGCTGVIFAYVGNSPTAAGMPIAYGSGTCAVDIPIASNGGGLQVANLIAGSVKSVFALGTAITNYKSGNVAGTMTSAWEAGTRAVRTGLAINNNLTTCLGMSGDQSSFYLPNKAYIKVVRPRVSRDNNYAKSNAYPVCTNGSLSGHGFCIAINPDLSSIQNATDSEKVEMYQLITTGVYT